MRKNYFALLLAIMCIAGKSNAQTVQPCGTDEMFKQYKQLNPELLINEKKLNDEIASYLKNRSLDARLGRTTDDADTFWIDIPLVVHVMHNGGAEILPDNKIYALVSEMNRFYSLHSDTASVIRPFKKYVAKAYIRFHLATKDPNGNPTKGITHRYTYLTYGGDDQAKMDQWPNSSYVNIWFENVIGAQITGGIIVAYAEQPASASLFPFWDGIISNYLFINDAGAAGGSIDHEMGHVFNLYHTFGHTNNPGTNTSGNCTDDDQVDDTPPTQGHLGGCVLFDTVCAQNYFQIYTDIHGNDSLVNYPDTANEQNIMNYADCKVMFTHGQVARMRAALRSSAGGRSNLWTPSNLLFTGVTNPDGSFAATPDLKPIPDFVVFADSVFSGTTVTNRNNYMNRVHRFTFPGAKVKFTNTSWNDTVTSVDWSFSSGAAIPTTTLNAVSNTFSEGGWVNVSLTAHANSGDATITDPRAVFVSDPTATLAEDVVMEFDNADTAKWPTFNYYNNEFKWQPANVGYYDHNSIQYVGFDSRIVPLMGIYPNTGTPKGDFDDLFSAPVNLTNFSSGNCNLNFYYSAASRSSLSTNINDELDIDYSTNGLTWINLTKITKNKLINKGALSIPYYPVNMSDWAPMSVQIPTAARTAYTVFRFRYKPGVAVGSDGNPYIFSSGNNFFMDRITFSAIPVSVNTAQLANIDIAVVPNPTNGDAYVVVKDANNATAHVVVTDITGKVVYTTSELVTGSKAQILIPHTAISVPGMYMVQTSTGNQARTQKLVVY